MILYDFDLCMPVWLEAHALLMMVVAGRIRCRLAVILQRYLVVMCAVIWRCNALVTTSTETSSLLDLQTSTAGVWIFGLGVPETALVASVVWV